MDAAKIANVKTVLKSVVIALNQQEYLLDPAMGKSAADNVANSLGTAIARLQAVRKILERI